ncbi:MAG TPA: hypothetical protein VFG86_16160, partial [Chloroflexota bacterium]|nr:hypothetical protein [Chloroflexota bacterium]
MHHAATREHSISFVAPGTRALEWLADTLGELQRDDPLQPITVIAHSPYLVDVLRQHVATSAPANVRFVVQLRPLAERIGRALGSRAFDEPLTGPRESAAIRVAVRDAAGPVLQPLAGNRALQDSLGSLFRELGHLGADHPALETIATGGNVGAAATHTYERFITLTHEFPDVPAQLRIATRLLQASPARPRWARDLGALVFYLPENLDAAERAFLSALAAHVPLQIALPCLHDAEADRPIDELASRVSSALGVDVQPCSSSVPRPSIHVLSAPDPDEEARCIVRRLLADMESGIPLWRMAVLYTSEELYAPLIRETLDAAEVPWHSALGRPAARGIAARSLLALLDLRERGFAREAVLDWLAARPTPSEDADEPLPRVPISAWDRLSRRAEVLQGADQWIARFERLVQTLEFEEQQRQPTEETPRLTHDVEYARSILAAIRRIDRDTRPPREPATWQALVLWASTLRRTYVPEDPAWPEPERAASAALEDTLASLQQASALESTTTVAGFRDALAAALDARRLDEGRHGFGVLVAPLGASFGAAFDRTFIVGMAEGLIPARPAADPLFAGATGDPLGRRERQRSADRRAFLAALTSSEAMCLSFARSDGAARGNDPSRWLLEQIAHVEGVPTVFASDLPRLLAPERPWLEHVASAYSGVQRGSTALNVADLRLREVVGEHVRGLDLGHSALVARADLVLGRAVRAARARQSREFTEFDGNL